MPPSRRTYDATPEKVWDDEGVEPPFVGASTFNNGNFRFWDGQGIFNPRRPWSNIIDGPDDSIAAALYQVINYVSGTIFVSSIFWYSDAAKTKPVASEVYTYSGTAYTTPTKVTYTLYDVTSGAAIRTCTDTYTYSSGTIFVSGVARVLT